MARRNNVQSQLIPEIKEWPIYKLYQERSELISEIDELTTNFLIQKHGDKIEQIISRTLYLEQIRLNENPWKVDPPNEKQFWKRVRKELAENSKHRDDVRADRDRELLRRVVNRYSQEIAGNFNPKTFLFARKFLTGLFRRMLNTAAGKNQQRIWGSKFELYDRLHVYGDLEHIRSLFSKGTIVIVPTHSSNLDSMLIGYALDMIVGLPSFSYGAGLNLYDSEIVAYYLSRLGPYRVDRRKRNPIYLETLKTMSQLSLEKGTNSLFFPGGTRSRSGEIETDLKFGLMASLVAAQRSSLRKSSPNKIFVIPLILSYHFVLEAKYLINGYLKRVGEERYEASRDEFQSLRKILDFAWQFFKKGSEMTLSFGKPMDVLGNYVDADGKSVDDRGKHIRISEYFDDAVDDKTQFQRERVYTRNLAQKISESYLKDNVVLSSQIVAFAGFQILQKMNPRLDIFGLSKLPNEDFIFDEHLFKSVVSQIMHRLKEMESKGEILLPEEFHAMETEKLIIDGIEKLGVFHTLKPLRYDKKGKIISDSFKFLYFYHNRLVKYELDRDIVWSEELLEAAEQAMI